VMIDLDLEVELDAGIVSHRFALTASMP
jgi:hypothetical protein